MKSLELFVALVRCGPIPIESLAKADLAKAKNCMGCHAVASKLLGPGFKDVAAEYVGQDVEDKLATKIINGGAERGAVCRCRQARR